MSRSVLKSLKSVLQGSNEVTKQLNVPIDEGCSSR